MSLPRTAEEAIGPRERFMLGRLAKAGEELAIDWAACSHCGAKPGEYCNNPRNGKIFRSGMHVSRRLAAGRMRHDNPKEWKRQRDETFARLIRERG